MITDDRHHRLLVTGLLMVLLATILARKLQEPFGGLHSWAEAHHAWIARAHLHYGLGYTRGLCTWAVGDPPPAHPGRYLDHPQLEWLLKTVDLAVFGVNEWASRLTDLLIATLSLPLLLRLLRALFDEVTAVLATLFLVLFPLTGYFGVGGWMFPLSLWALWCYLVLIGGLRGGPVPRPFHWWGLGAALFLMLQLNWAGFFYALAIGTHYIMHGAARRLWPDTKLFLVLLLCPLASLALVFAVLLAARGWDHHQMIALYRWRSSVNSVSGTGWGAWSIQLLQLLLHNYTLPVLLVVGAYLLHLAGALVWRWRGRRRTSVPLPPNNRTTPPGVRRSFPYMWLFLTPGVFLILTFKELFWEHEYWLMPLTVFMAVAAALGILRLRDLLAAWNRPVGTSFVATAVTLVFVFCTVGLQRTFDVTSISPVMVEMFQKLNRNIPPEQALLSYEDFLVSEHPAKGSFYRPEIAWYLDRPIVPARTWEEIQTQTATGRFPYYLVLWAPELRPLIMEMKEHYPYEFICGHPPIEARVGMPPYLIFDLQRRPAGAQPGDAHRLP